MTEIHYTDPEQFPDEIIVENSLRPSQFNEFIGQKDLIENLKLYLNDRNLSPNLLCNFFVSATAAPGARGNPTWRSSSATLTSYV